MPHDPVTTGQVIVEKSGHGEHDIALVSQYEAPADGDGNVAADEFRDYDMWVADQAGKLLQEVYPGHFWLARHDTCRHPVTGEVFKVLLISIPILMGVNNYMAINRKYTDLTPGRVIMAGGEILERYGLKRGRLQLAQFLEAREKHSALVVQSRKIPG